MTLKELRHINKKTAAEVAEKLGIAVSTLYNYEQGIRRVSIEQIIPLAELYDATEREVIEAQIESVKERQS